VICLSSALPKLLAPDVTVGRATIHAVWLI
jgi:hypothetical protein